MTFRAVYLVWCFNYVDVPHFQHFKFGKGVSDIVIVVCIRVTQSKDQVHLPYWVMMQYYYHYDCYMIAIMISDAGFIRTLRYQRLNVCFTLWSLPCWFMCKICIALLILEMGWWACAPLRTWGLCWQKIIHVDNSSRNHASQQYLMHTLAHIMIYAT